MVSRQTDMPLMMISKKYDSAYQMSKKRDCVHMHRVKLKINDLDKSLLFFVLGKCKVQSLATDILSKERLQLQLVLFMPLALQKKC